MEAWMEERLDQINALLAEDHLKEAKQALNDLHPADVAHLMENLEEAEKRKLFSVLNPKIASEVVVELSEFSRDQVLENIHTGRLAAIVDDLPSDEATDIIADLPAEQAQDVLDRIDLEDSAEVRALLKYDEDTAGGIMQLELVSARPEQTAAQAIEALRIKRDEVETVHNVFITDRQRRLLGVVPLTKLILADPETPLSQLMEPCPLIVRFDEDQEEVAHKFRRYDLGSAPVVDDHQRLLGRITIDDVMEIMEEEVQEDLLRMAGTYSEGEDMFYSDKVFKISRLRLPWLLGNLLGGLVSGWLLWQFRVNLPDALFLLGFIPVINAMAGNVGLQSSTIIVRGIAVGRVNYNNLWRILFKEFKVAVVMGLACGITVGLVAHIWHHNPILGLVVGLAMACAISSASVLGTLAPALFKKLGVDPAISSGPVVSTFNDVMSMVIYFTISTVFYRLLIV